MNALRSRVDQLSQKTVRLNLGTPSEKNHFAQGTISSRGSKHPVPDDVIYELAHYLDTFHLYILLLLTRSIHEMILPLLWANIDTRESVNPEKQIGDLRAALKLKPEKALLIKRLVIGTGDIMLETSNLSDWTTAKVLLELSGKGHLRNLTKFWWFCKKPPSDDLWASLNLNCPLLRDIGIRRGPDDLVIDPGSSLLKFRDLRSFHLTNHGVYRYHDPNQIKVAASAAASIPPGLYEMLIKHCPNLQQLTFDGSCSEKSIWDVWPILHGTWPELHSVSLGMIKCFRKTRSQTEESAVVAKFMDRHPKLQELRFSGAAHWASREAEFTLPSHDNLRYFWGQHAQLKPAEFLPRLKNVFLTDLFSDSANYSVMFRRFKSITTLGLIVDEQQGKATAVCQSIFDACPLLVHLDLRLRGGLLSYGDIAEMSQKAVHLRSLTLAGGYNLLDNVGMSTKGLAMIKKNPRLESFALYFGDQFTRTAVSRARCERFALGEFVVLRDRPRRIPTRLFVKEIRRGISTSVTPSFAHRYVKEIPRES